MKDTKETSHLSSAKFRTKMGEKPLRNHKDSTFRLLFSEPERAIELYNAVSGENLPPDTALTYTTLENAVYVDRNNDLGFVVLDRHLVLSECQSTINMNIPMRCLGYVSRTLENLTGQEGLYGKKAMKFPTPQILPVLYRNRKMGESKTLFVGQLSGKTERKFSRTCCKPY